MTTPQEKLLEIENNPYTMSLFEHSHHLYSTLVADNRWLVSRIKQLESALEIIAQDFGTDYCDGNCVRAKEVLEEMPSEEKE